ncbi:cytochrome P450 [Amylocystis lapponica]|nr:cytochrome P450 [Amylocystis lapponica]
MQPYLFIQPFVGLFLFRTYFAFRKAVRSIHNFPGFRTVFRLANLFLPGRIRGITPGYCSPWTKKHQDFIEFGSDIFSVASAVQSSQPLRSNITFYVADAEALKEITNSRTRFIKPVRLYRLHSVFGNNIVASELNQWKRHIKIVVPAFTESIRTMLDLFSNVWGEQQEVVVDNIVDLTGPIVLHVVSVASFGRQMTWSDDVKAPPGHAITFQEALHTVSADLFLKIVLPQWMIQARKQEKEVERYDLFSSLLDANEDGPDNSNMRKLSDSELMGNIFIFLVAAYAFIMLALHQDEQDILYQHVKSVLLDGKVPAYEDMGRLSYSLAMFPPVRASIMISSLFPVLIIARQVCSIPKYATEDTTLVTRNTMGEPVHVVVPKGANVFIHSPELHYNPRYWEDPYDFKPARFLGDWPRNAFLPFSGGARSCLGRKFAETEGVAALSLLILHYRIDVKEDPQFASETFAQRKARLLNSRTSITMYPVKAPLVFKRR